MALKSKSVQGQFAAATASLLAASASLTRYIRSIHVTNDTNSQQSWNLAFAATATAAGPGVFGEQLAPNSRAAPIHYSGKGKRIDNTTISGFASTGAGLTYEILYDESDTVDA